MVTLDDIAAAVIARTAGSAAFRAALPGKAWLDRPPDNPAGAYAIFTLERDGTPEFFSDDTYLQGYTLRMAAYTVQAIGTVTPQQAQLAMADAINPGPTAWSPLRDGVVNLCLPRGYDGKHDPELRQGKDVFSAAAQWSLTVEGNVAP